MQWFRLIPVLAFLWITGCNIEDREIEYHVTSDRVHEARIWYRENTEDFIVASVTLPWTHSFTSDGASKVEIMAEPIGGGTITVKTYVDGGLCSEKTSIDVAAEAICWDL
ncbi:MAG: hypothetical protein K9N38_06865 [Candidatus Marinimicrobia bacterium]|nr:hypothetical protein [Candidatus Neomarinimicrobiota bacterium]